MKFKIFSYNVHGLPFIAESWTLPLAKWFHGTDYDCICLQEVFTAGRVSFLSEGLTAAGYTVIKPNDVSGNFLSSGLITAVRNKWTVVDTLFQAYEAHLGIEKITNKGFHWLKLKKGTEIVQIVNTHLQANSVFNIIFATFITSFEEIRRRQIAQMLLHLERCRGNPCFIIGDTNAGTEPHADIRYLTGARQRIIKHTFESTGEDLDHVAIVPHLWHLWDVPVVRKISVLHKLWWSDHWPLHVSLTYETSLKQ